VRGYHVAMNARTLELLLCAIVSGCGSGTTCAALASPSAAPTPTIRTADVPPPPAPTVQPSTEKPPYESGAVLAPHEVRKWVLVVDADGLKPNPSAFQVAETRVGDLPMPAGSPWRCRFDHAAVLEKYGSVTRDVTCSSDGWRTQVEFTGGYCTRPDCQMREGDVDFQLRRDGAGPHSPGTPGAVGVTFGPRRKLDDAKYPELP